MAKKKNKERNPSSQIKDLKQIANLFNTDPEVEVLELNAVEEAGDPTEVAKIEGKEGKILALPAAKTLPAEPPINNKIKQDLNQIAAGATLKAEKKKVTSNHLLVPNGTFKGVLMERYEDKHGQAIYRIVCSHPSRVNEAWSIMAFEVFSDPIEYRAGAIVNFEYKARSVELRRNPAKPELMAWKVTIQPPSKIENVFTRFINKMENEEIISLNLYQLQGLLLNAEKSLGLTADTNENEAIELLELSLKLDHNLMSLGIENTGGKTLYLFKKVEE